MPVPLFIPVPEFIPVPLFVVVVVVVVVPVVSVPWSSGWVDSSPVVPVWLVPASVPPLAVPVVWAKAGMASSIAPPIRMDFNMRFFLSVIGVG
jgi:hypothetical protein